MEELFKGNENNLYFMQNIVTALIQQINEVGIIIKDFESNLKGNLNKIKKDSSQLATIRLTSKDISTKLSSLLLPLANKGVDLPDKLFDSLSFLSVKYLDIINSYSDLIDQNPIGDIIKALFLFYSKKTQNINEFLSSKSKYIDTILKLIYSQIDNNLFDLRTHFSLMLDFAIYIQINSSIQKKIGFMPGIVSKIIKSVTLLEVKFSSVILKKMLWVLNDFMKIVIIHLRQEDDNRKQFNSFYFCFMDAIKSRVYSKKISKILKELIEINVTLMTEINKQKYSITIEEFDTIFYMINRPMLESEMIDYSFYTVCSSMININECSKRLIDEMKEIKVTYKRKESDKFNRGLYNLCGMLMIYLCNFKSLSDTDWDNQLLKTENNPLSNTLSNLLHISSSQSKSKSIIDISLHSIINELFDLLSHIIKCNCKIIFEAVNQFEISIKKISNTDCKDKIISSFLKSIIYTNELNFNQSLLYNILQNHLYVSYPKVYSYLINKTFNNLFNQTKIFISSLSKESITKKQLHFSLTQSLDSLALFIYVNDLSFKTTYHITNTGQFKAILSFFSSYLCDNETIDAFEKAKISQNQIVLINFFTLSLSIIGILSPTISFNKQEKNALIMLGMLNYSSKLTILKYSASWLIFLLSNDSDVKQFIIENFNLIIHTILNKVIYFSANLSNAKSNIFNFFSSLIELIKDINNEEMNNFYCGEFTKYIQYLFPYIDSNMKSKSFPVLEIILEIIVKITQYQNVILLKLFKEFETNYSDDASKMALENNNTEYFISFVKKKIEYDLNSNIFRQCILRIAPLMLSGQIKLVSKSLSVISNLIPLLHLLPMRREENENFSPEDGENVIIKSSLGPVMHEIWREIVYALECQGKRKDMTTIADFKLFYSIFMQIMNYYPRFFSSERMFTYLLPAVDKVFSIFDKIYKIQQYSKIVNDFVFEFISRACFVNHYSLKYKDVISNFIGRYYKCYEWENNLNADDNIRSILEYFN